MGKKKAPSEYGLELFEEFLNDLREFRRQGFITVDGPLSFDASVDERVKRFARQLTGDDYLGENFSAETLYRVARRHLSDWARKEKRVKDIRSEFRNYLTLPQKTWDIVIPIENLKFDESLPRNRQSLRFGSCHIRSLPQKYEDAFYRLSRHGGPDKEFIEEMYVKYYREHAVAILKGISACEPRKSVEKGRKIANESIKTFSFFKDQAWIWGSLAPPISLSDAALAVRKDGEPELILGGSIDWPLILTEPGLENLSKARRRLAYPNIRDIVMTNHSTSFTKIMRLALSLISKADNEEERMNRFLWYIIALDQLFTSPQVPEVSATSQVDKALMLISGAAPGVGRDLYVKRSKIAHGEDLDVNEDEVRTAIEGVKRVFIYLAELQDQIESKDDLLIFLKEMESVLVAAHNGAEFNDPTQRSQLALRQLRRANLLVGNNRLTARGGEVRNHLLRT